ncbi:MAG: prepilin-type N-terminal cleavage/methylation domain-containing protein [Proteobacteria bacterium]|nr:prepilin-type N-terminal cleavage/methylation domain-containing protein [Pseudomonadota bacterium]
MRKGFTLLEVMIAAAILAVGTLGVLGMQMSVGEYNRGVSMRMSAVSLAEQQLAILELQALDGCKAGTICRALTTAPHPDWTAYNLNGASSSTNGILASSNGIFGWTGDLDNRYYVAYYNLAHTSTDPTKLAALCPEQECIRGAIRVTWAKSAQRAQECQLHNAFTDFENKDGRSGKLQCEFVSLPFIFSTTNIYKT